MVEQPEGHEEQRDEQDQPARDHQMERASIQAELVDSFRQVHSRVRWYGNHEHEYNDLEETAKKANLPFKRYQRQTRTRWSSQVSELASDLFNNAAQSKQHQEKSYVPKPMDPATCEHHARICGVLTPHLVGARILEHETPDMSASCYLPTWKGVMAQLGEQGKVPRLERRGPWGRQDSGPAYYNDDELLYVAKRLRNWLAKDTKMTYEIQCW